VLDSTKLERRCCGETGTLRNTIGRTQTSSAWLEIRASSAQRRTISVLNSLAQTQTAESGVKTAWVPGTMVMGRLMIVSAALES